MIQQLAAVALLLVSSGAFADQAVEKQSIKPKLKEAKNIKVLTQKLFHHEIATHAKAPLADIHDGKLKAVQIDVEALIHQGSEAAQKAAPVSGGSVVSGHANAALRGNVATLAAAPTPKNLKPGTPAHTVAHTHAHVGTENWLYSARTKMFSPNKGFIEYGYYEDYYCSTPINVSGTAVNFCYYDEETGTSEADVAVFKKYSSGSTYFSVNNFVFDDMYCTSVNTANTTTDYWGNYRGSCYTQYGYDDSGVYGYLYSYKYDHVQYPSTNLTSSTTFGFHEYKTEGACNNWNNEQLANYGSFTASDMGCSEYFYEGEYFMLSCSDSVVMATVYSDSTCSTELRTEELSDLCDSEMFTYATRLVCDSSV